MDYIKLEKRGTKLMSPINPKIVKNKRRKRTIALVVVALTLIIIGSLRITGVASDFFSAVTGNYGQVHLIIECKQLSENPSLLKDDNLKKYLPKDGYILDKQVKLNKDDTVFKVTSEACKKAGVHMDSEYTQGYGTYYVKGIGYLYEFSAGKNSGWTYKVNGKAPNYGADKIKVKDGDKIVWHYTVDYKKE